MRTLTMLAVFLLAGSPLLAVDLGTATYDLKSGGQDSLSIPEGTSSIPFELYLSVTTAGPDGPNYGVANTHCDIRGSAMVGIIQESATLNPDFASPYDPSVGQYGLGFDVWSSGGVGGTLYRGYINALGGRQTLPDVPGPGLLDMPGAFTANAPYPNGRPPLLIATGTLHLDPTLPAGSDHIVWTATSGGSVTLWPSSSGSVSVSGGIINEDTIPITIVPEPATLSLLALGSLALLRQRR